MVTIEVEFETFVIHFDRVYFHRDLPTLKTICDLNRCTIFTTLSPTFTIKIMQTLSLQ